MTNQQKKEKYLEICNTHHTNVKVYEYNPCTFIQEGSLSLHKAIFRNARKVEPSTFTIGGQFDVAVVDELMSKGALVHSSCYMPQVYKENSIEEWNNVARVYEMDGVWIKVNIVFVQRPEKYELEVNDVALIHRCGVDVKFAVDLFEKYRVDVEETPSIGIIKQTNGRLYISYMEMEDNQTYSDNYYNEDFPEFLDDIIAKLEQNKAGLFLLHGEPGTGKSSAIRHIIKQMYDRRKFVFVPPHMTHSLAMPEFADLLTGDGKGSVLVVEDAEKALMKRESADGFHNSELVSSVLNLTDGLYADITKTAIIATYNCDRSHIDGALLRKGRLKAEYEFKKLEADRAQALADELGNDMNIKEATTLAEIFNYGQQYSNSDTNKKTKRVVGFGS